MIKGRKVSQINLFMGGWRGGGSRVMLRKLICQVYCILMKGEPINSGFFGNKVNMFTFIESLLKIQIATKKNLYVFSNIQNK